MAGPSGTKGFNTTVAFAALERRKGGVVQRFLSSQTCKVFFGFTFLRVSWALRGCLIVGFSLVLIKFDA